MPTNELWFGFHKQTRTHLFISYFKDTKKLQKKNTFDLSNFQFQNKQIPKTYILGSFLDEPLHCSQNQKQLFLNIFADPDLCIKYRDFGTWVSRWSKWNGGLTICSHFLRNYGLITNKSWKLFHVVNHNFWLYLISNPDIQEFIVWIMHKQIVVSTVSEIPGLECLFCSKTLIKARQEGQTS